MYKILGNILILFLGSFLLVAAEKKPNFLVIMVDDLGYGDLSSYGAQDIKTPVIDQLMKEGMRFTQFTANSCVCSPTRAAFLTGRYQDLVGVPGVIRTPIKSNFGHLDPKAVALPEILKKGGYRTSLIGKWHLGLEAPNLPNNRGFEEFKGFQADMMEDYWTYKRYGKNYMYHNEKQLDIKGKHATELFTEWSIEELRKAKKDGRPFFQFLAYNAPHDPIQPPKESLEKFKKNNPKVSEKRALLGALIEHMDENIGKVIQELKDLGVYDNTMIVFTSDNGGDLKHLARNSPWKGGKTQVYEGGLKVCSSVTWSGKIKPASESSLRVMTMDILPTIIEAAGLKIPHNVEGQSFLSALTKGEDPEIFSTRPQIYTWLQDYKKHAIRLGDWKLVKDTENSTYELYNLKDEITESKNLAAENSKKAAELLALIQDHLKKAEKVNWQRPK